MEHAEEEQKELIEPISKEIFSSSIDLTVDYSELSLDSFLDNGVLKDIPVIKTVYAVFKIGKSIKEAFFLKKFLTFLKEFNSKDIEEYKLNEFKYKFETDGKFRHKITEHLIVFNEAFLHVDKSKVLAKLFRSHIEGKFDWEHFSHLSACLNTLHPKAFSFLKELAEIDFNVAEKKKEGYIRKYDLEAMLIASGIGYTSSVWSSGFQVSDLGKDLFNFGINY